MRTDGSLALRGEAAGQGKDDQEGQGMSVASLIGRSILGIWAAALLAVLAVAAPAGATEPWWHLALDSAPAVLQSGQAKDEVQQITVSATGGSFELQAQTAPFAGHAFAWNATHQELQEGLEEIYGKGNVEVPSGRGDEAGDEPYEVIFKGALSDRPVVKPKVSSSVTGGGSEVTVKQTVLGHADGTLLLTVANMSGADLAGSAPVKVSVKLPAGLSAVQINGTSGFIGFGRPECSLEALTCTTGEPVMPYEQLQVLVAVNVEPGAKTGELDEIAVSGGDASPASKTRPVAVESTTPAYGVENYEMSPEEEGGGVATQAGSHPFQLTTTLMLNQRELRNEENELGFYYTSQPAEMTKDLAFRLPPGLIGNPTPFPQCQLTKFLKSVNGFVDECPDDTALGVAAVTVQVPKGYPLTTVTVPLFNLSPSVGEPARFGFIALGVPVYLDTSVRTGGDYGVTVTVSSITQTAVFVGSRVTFWGVPGDPRHDNARGWSCVADGLWQSFAPELIPPCSPSGQHQPPPFLELPTSCTGPLQTTVEADSWQREGSFVSSAPSLPLPSLDGCNELPFSPSVSVAPDGQAGSTPTGLTVGIHVPQEVSLDAEGLGESDVKSTTVTLPAGVALNPAAADGLLACSEAQIALQVHAAPSCPEASKVGTVEIDTPLLPNRLTGAAYLAAQDANPFGSLVALYIVAEDPVSGTLVKVAGEVKPDPVTGQLVSTFDNTPQLPFEDLKLHFFGGSRAPLSTPAACGSYTTAASIAGWSDNPPSEPSSAFQITSGPDGSACASPLPFAPTLTAGSTNIQTGAFSPFTMTMSREDGQQSLKAVRLNMPPGLLGTLSSVKLCGEAEADAGTCGPESLIGETVVSVGLGGNPFSVRGGKVYITGPYRGAPYGLSIVNPAKAGPFDLGNVIVRARIEVDPVTAALTVTTDDSGPYAIPQILDGIPLQIKHVNVSINRPDFTFNPTNCAPMAITGALTSSEGATDALSVPFQVTNCATLAFKPQFKVSTSGKTSRAKGASLDVKLSYPKAAWGSQANIRSVKVDLPRQLPSRLSTLQQACVDSTFDANPASCPAGSRIGTATATTPIIPVELSGPAYFVSHAGLKFPELVIVLSGYGVTVQLHGETFITGAGVTSSTFRTIPDVPIGGFELKLPEGSNSALAAPKNLCTATLKMPTAFTAQNGAIVKQSTPIGVTGCAKHKAKSAGKHKKKGKPRK
jgi:hypothetical protein